MQSHNGPRIPPHRTRTELPLYPEHTCHITPRRDELGHVTTRHELFVGGNVEM